MTQKKRKIAIYYNLPSGGALKMIREIIKFLKKEKYQVDIYSISEDIERREKIENVNEIRVKPWRGFILRNLWIVSILPIFHKRMAKYINDKKYDYVLINHDYFTKCPYIIKYIKLKTVYICQEPQREFYEPARYHAPLLKDKIANILRLPIKYIDRINVSYAKKIISNSYFSNRNIQKIYKKNSDVVYPGVDKSMFVPNKGGVSNYILSIGGFTPSKGHVFVVNSIKQLLNRYKLIIVGNGRKADRDRIVEGVEKWEGKIIFLHDISEKRMIDLYQNAQLLCIGAYREPFGLSSIEAQACGTPVVAVKSGGLTETIINNKTGYLVNRIEKKFLNACMSGIKNRSRLRINCIKNSKKWDWSNTLQKLDRIILEP